jgi:pyruvate kinase
MKIQIAELEIIDQQIIDIIKKAKTLEETYFMDISQVDPVYTKSAQNLIHYLAFRSFDIASLQDKLRKLGLPSLTNIEGHVMESLRSIKTIINHLLGRQIVESTRGVISSTAGKKRLYKNTKQLFGYKSKKRRTRIMVTMPNTAAEDPVFIKKLLKSGMNSARINCAHDDPAVWKEIIENIEQAKVSLNKNCKVMMDLGGPKLRTGPMEEGPKLLRIRPERNSLGETTNPAKIWIAPSDVWPPNDTADAILPIDEFLFNRIKRGNELVFTDTRGKKCKITIDKKEGPGKWGLCNESAYLTTGMEMELHRKKQSGKIIVNIGEVLPLEQYLRLKTGDVLILKGDPAPGQNAVYDASGRLLKPAFVSCTLPEIFSHVKQGELIFFDDGKIEGIINEVHPDRLHIKITYAKDLGSKLKADKGINLPQSDLPISGLTEKDKKDMEFVLKNADAVNFSFVNQSSDVQDLLDVIDEHDGNIGVILKIETKKGFMNLPKILLKAMRIRPIGVMIAREIWRLKLAGKISLPYKRRFYEFARRRTFQIYGPPRYWKTWRKKESHPERK